MGLTWNLHVVYFIPAYQSTLLTLCCGSWTLTPTPLSSAESVRKTGIFHHKVDEERRPLTSGICPTKKFLGKKKKKKSKAQVNKAGTVRKILKFQTPFKNNHFLNNPSLSEFSYDAFNFPTSITLHLCGIYAKIRATWSPSPKPK